MSLASTQAPSTLPRPPSPSLSPHPPPSGPTDPNIDLPNPSHEQAPTATANASHTTQPPAIPPCSTSHPPPPPLPRQSPSRRRVLDSECALAQVESRLRALNAADMSARERHVEELGDAHLHRLAGHIGDNTQRAIACYTTVCAWMRKRGEGESRARVLAKLGRALCKQMGCMEAMDEGEAEVRQGLLDRAVEVFDAAVGIGDGNDGRIWLYGGFVREKTWERGEGMGKDVREGCLREWVRWLERALEGKGQVGGMERVRGVLSLVRGYLNMRGNHEGIRKAVRLLESVEPVLREAEEEGEEVVQGETNGLKEEMRRLKEEVGKSDRYMESRCVIC